MKRSMLAVVGILAFAGAASAQIEVPPPGLILFSVPGVITTQSAV